MHLETLINSLWEENKLWALARSRNLYDDIERTVAGRSFSKTYELLEQASTIPEYNFQFAADRLWKSVQDAATDTEAREWGDLEKVGDILTTKEFLWQSILRHRAKNLLNCRLLFDINPFDRYLFVAGNQEKLYLWNGGRFVDIDIPRIARKSIRLHDPNYLLTVLVNGHPYRNPKLQDPIKNQ